MVSKKKRLLVKILIAAAIVAFWRGCWVLMDIYLFPNDLVLSAISAIAIGIIILFATDHIEKDWI